MPLFTDAKMYRMVKKIFPMKSIVSTNKISNMKDHFYLSLLLVFFFSQTSFAQTDNGDMKERKNQIKINLIPLVAFNTVQLSYERTIKDNFTIGGSINGSFSKDSPSFIDLGGITELSFSGDEFSSFAIMPQFKWYPNLSNRKAPHGFYLGGLLRYQNLGYKTDVKYDDVLTNTSDFNMDTALNSFSIGMELGYQIKFKNNWLLDFSFFGPRMAFHTLTIETSETLDNETLSALSEELNNVIGGNLFETDATVTNDSEKEKFTSLGFRYAISVGYNF